MLPSARLISTVIHPDVDRPHCHYTLLLMHFGQFMDHDINHTPSTTLTGYGKASNIQCCEIPHGLAGHPACFPIEIPPSDPYYAKYYLKCMNFVRSEAAPRPGCTLGPREQVNQLTSFLDGSQIYGSTYEDMKNIRLYQFGRLRTVFVDYCHKDVLPPDLETADCPDANATLPCFRAGDSRVNENTGLATLHTIFTREHNRIADELYYLNPYWDDERLFQEARKIVGALLQHILYNEWLPLVLGKDVMYQNDLLPTPSGYYGGYDKNINPTIANVFATAALRFGHTLIPSWFRFFNKYHEYIGQKQLRDAFFKPYPLYQPGIIDMYLLGMINDNVQKRDTFISSEVTEHLFEAMPTHGVDLAAINVQRGRDHGIPPYNAWREFCGLPKAYAFDDLKDVMRAEIVERFKTVYEHVEDIDLFPAGIAEEPLHDGLLGPTFTCILTKQFVHLKRGDRFWYENDVQPQAFTPDQLNAIRATSIARVICDNSDDIDTIQPKAFLHVLPSVNERVPCKGPFLPRLDLSAWKEISRETVELKGAVHEAVQDAVYPKPVTEPAYRK
ncbi:hypothetical protein RvY_04560 [Ramazzottius varieornatus]|uniref:Uncharacterized protein n=1 Tax=Ramazzottius varieornatus TaxID=947166 RepID=A0A1D1UVK4_RAMVA|nr:hypothetical protein RvY_04560 [Ramazzottius varieornatus]